VAFTMEINYKEWRRLDWARYYGFLVHRLGMEQAQAHVWDDWNQDRNPIRYMFPNKTALLFTLATARIPAYMGTNQEFIQWDSNPVYADDNAYWNGTVPWNCADWKLWHQRLKAKHGLKKTNPIWLHAWSDSRNKTVNNSWLAWYQSLAGSYGGVLAATNFNLAAICPGDCDFISYFYAQGIDIASVFGQTGCNLQNIVVEAGNTASNLFGMASGLTAVLKWGIPIGVVVAGVYYTRKIVKNG
jgi:hypothetical protein